MAVNHENIWACPPWCDVNHEDDDAMGDPEQAAIVDPDSGVLHGHRIEDLAWEPFDGIRDERLPGARVEVQQYVNSRGRYPLGVAVQVVPSANTIPPIPSEL